jgi:hypothetical protein
MNNSTSSSPNIDSRAFKFAAGKKIPIDPSGIVLLYVLLRLFCAERGGGIDHGVQENQRGSVKFSAVTYFRGSNNLFKFASK